MSNETTDISSEIEKIAKEGQAEKTGARKFRFPDFTIFLWGWFFISLILLMVIAWNYLQNSVYDQGVRTGAQNTAAQIYTDMINKAANDQCNTIFVQYENRRVDLINVRCLQILNQNKADSDAAATEQNTEKK